MFWHFWNYSLSASSIFDKPIKHTMARINLARNFKTGTGLAIFPGFDGPFSMTRIVYKKIFETGQLNFKMYYFRWGRPLGETYPLSNLIT